MKILVLLVALMAAVYETGEATDNKQGEKKMIEMNMNDGLPSKYLNLPQHDFCLSSLASLRESPSKFVDRPLQVSCWLSLLRGGGGAGAGAGAGIETGKSFNMSIPQTDSSEEFFERAARSQQRGSKEIKRASRDSSEEEESLEESDASVREFDSNISSYSQDFELAVPANPHRSRLLPVKRRLMAEDEKEEAEALGQNATSLPKHAVSALIDEFGHFTAEKLRGEGGRGDQTADLDRRGDCRRGGSLARH
eukprot:768423-Hanusia_phi.AAC.2